MNQRDEITVDLIRDWFKVGKNIQKFQVEGSATKGFGLPLPKSSVPEPEKKIPEDETDYVQKYLAQEEKWLQSELDEKDETNNEEPSSMYDLEEATTIGGVPQLSDLNEDLTQVYEHYDFRNKYNSKLLIAKYKEDIINAIETQQVIILEGATGSGKTTQVPQYILDHYVQLNRHCNIIVTQPRKIAAVSIATRVCSERNWQLGSIVGYQVGLDNRTSADTRLSFVTTGVLLQRLITKKHMNDFTHVILDEVHERDQEMDLSLLIVRKFLKSVSKHVKVILMSATFDSNLFGNYFALQVNGRLEEPITISLEGKGYPVSEHWINDLSLLGPIPELDPLVPEIPEESYNLAYGLIKIFDKIEIQEQGSEMNGFAPSRGSVLVFLPGLEEINNMERILQADVIQCRWWILPLHSTITVEEQQRVFERPQPGDRKIILSTNIAESSVTVSDIKYIIDFCLTKNLFSDEDTNYTSLRLEWASKANCKQRKGRAGRVSAGRVYRLITSEFYDKVLEEFIVPEMKRCPLEQVILKIKTLDLGEPRALLALALEPPNISDIKKSILALKEVGALDLLTHGKFYPYDGDITFIGKIMAALPVDIHISKLIALGFVFGCMYQCIVIGAGLSLKSCFSKPLKEPLNSYRNKTAWANGTFSDCIAVWFAFRVWKQHKANNRFKRPNRMSEKQWCQRNFLQMKRLIEMDLLVTELIKRLENLNITVPSIPMDDETLEEKLLIKVVIAGAFYPHYFIRAEPDDESIARTLSGFDPFTTVMLSSLPKDGYLYELQIKNYFEEFGCDPQLHFENSKVFVQFNVQRNKDDKEREKAASKTKVLPAVYLSVKKRHLQIPLRLKLYSAETLIQRAKQMELLTNQKSEDEHRLRTNRIGTMNPSELKHVALPSLQQTVISVYVTEVITCGHFWAHYGDDDAFEKLRYLQTLTNNDSEKLEAIEGSITPGVICLAPYTEGTFEYHRARIEAVRSAEVEVFFVDYGNMETVPKSALRAINKEKYPQLLTIEMQAFECILSEVKPSPVSCPTGTWTDEATKLFTNYVKETPLFARVYSNVKRVVHLELTKKDESGKEVSINELLIRLGYGERAEESFLSQQNYRLRQKYYNAPLQVPDVDEDENELYIPQDDKSFKLKFSNKLMKLSGPFSPLEIQFYALTQIGRMRRVKIEQDSINSVVLDEDPQDKTARMLCAASVSLSSNGMTLIARNTTLMPALKGLPAILALLFAPKAELRPDSKYTKYTGAICGLGYDPVSGESLYPEHDMEIVFDSSFTTDEDLHLINAIRMRIFHIMRQFSCEQIQYRLKKNQKDARDKLLQLLHLPRESVDPCPFKHTNKWCKIIPNRILKPLLKQEDPDCEHTLHCGISLYDNDEAVAHAAMIEHVKELHGKASRSQQPEEVHCDLCNITVYTPIELLFHLKSNVHRELERKLFGV